MVQIKWMEAPLHDITAARIHLLVFRRSPSICGLHLRPSLNHSPSPPALSNIINFKMANENGTTIPQDAEVQNTEFGDSKGKGKAVATEDRHAQDTAMNEDDDDEDEDEEGDEVC